MLPIKISLYPLVTTVDDPDELPVLLTLLVLFFVVTIVAVTPFTKTRLLTVDVVVDEDAPRG